MNERNKREEGRDARNGDTKFIPFGLADDIFQLSGAFQYGMW